MSIARIPQDVIYSEKTVFSKHAGPLSVDGRSILQSRSAVNHALVAPDIYDERCINFDSGAFLHTCARVVSLLASAKIDAPPRITNNAALVKKDSFFVYNARSPI